MDFIEMQVAIQMSWLDENGMYMDAKGTDVHQPMMYDLVSRGLFALLLHAGYRGRYRDAIDACLQKAGLLTLAMQSSAGEMPFGGRSNQFLHNESCGIIVLEYEAVRYAKEGNTALASKFKAAAAHALQVTEQWLSTEPIRHIKNRFPTETKYGCEFYAYFDKYMITVASNLYTAYLLCDDTIPTGDMADAAPCYTVDIEHPFGCSLCSGVWENDAWNFAAAGVSMLCRFADGQSVRERYAVSENGVQIDVTGEGKLAYMLPAFFFDGEMRPEIRLDGRTLRIFYDGWICRYSTDGEIADLGKIAANRNGHYRAFAAVVEKNLCVRIEIIRM